MQVNLLSHALLVGELLPLLRRSAAVRIALHSSGARFNVRPADVTPLGGGANGWLQYCKSKAGLCLLARALNSGRLREAGVEGVASVADPGICATGINVQHDLAGNVCACLCLRACVQGVVSAKPLFRGVLAILGEAICARAWVWSTCVCL